MMNQSQVFIVIAASSPLFLRSLFAYLRKEPFVRIVGLIRETSQIPAALENLHPHTLLLDASMVPEDLPGYLGRLRASYPWLTSIVLCDFPGQQAQCVQAGASQALLKGFLSENLRQAVGQP